MEGLDLRNKWRLRLIVLGVGFVAKKRGDEGEVCVGGWADLVPLTREGRRDFWGGVSGPGRDWIAFMGGG